MLGGDRSGGAVSTAGAASPGAATAAESGAALAALRSTAPALGALASAAPAPLPLPPAGIVTAPSGALRTLDSVPYQNSVVSLAGRGCEQMMRGVIDSTISFLSAESRCEPKRRPRTGMSPRPGM